MRVGIIVNPVSGRHGRRADTGRRRVEFARQRATAAGVEADTSLTSARGYAAELACAFLTRALDLIIVWGGDGTINDAAGPLIGTKTALGIVSSGSGRRTGAQPGPSADVRRAFALAIRAPAEAIDVGFLGNRHFLNVAGVGFYAVVARVQRADAARLAGLCHPRTANWLGVRARFVSGAVRT